jgi:hypothetical protein
MKRFLGLVAHAYSLAMGARWSSGWETSLRAQLAVSYRRAPRKAGKTEANERRIENQERWKELCAQIKVEQDPIKLQELTKEIMRLLDYKRKTNASSQALGDREHP